jgi:heavy metal translocating P-type ATPase
MIFGLALNLHDDIPPAVRDLAQWMLFAGTMLVAGLLGTPLVRTASAELRRGRLTIEALFLLTMFGALAASLQAHLTGRGKIYYEVVSVLLVVYTLGKVIGARSRAAALASSRAWGDRFGFCRVLDQRGLSRVAPVQEIRVGDSVEVHPGETIAVDGVIAEGVGFVSESAVSGEPFAVVRRPGDRVLAGSASFDATFRITATANGDARAIDQLLAAVECARDKPTSFQSHADRLGQWFFPLVVVTALGTFAYWSFLTTAGWESALFNSMSVLLVACPCVIGLATPIVIWSAINRLAERGVIVREGDAVERLAAVTCVMLDKTGTLTEDRFTLVDIQTHATGEARAKLLAWLSLVQSQSSHPIAKPFAELPRVFAPGELPRVHSLVAVPGRGIVAELLDARGTRHEMKIGTPELVPGEFPTTVTNSPNATTQTVRVSLNGEFVAHATVAERMRDSAQLALAHFRQLALPVEVLTGDANANAESLGVDTVRAGLLPQDKLAAVQHAVVGGEKPLFVGDGINDASALAAAHIGVALATGTDLAVNAAPVTLYGGDLHALPWAIELSRDAVRTVRANLVRALTYNLVGMTLAACGLLHPVVAALLMVVSSLSLLYSSSRVGHCVDLSRDRDTAPTVPRQQPTTAKAACHAFAFTAQGVLLTLLIPAWQNTVASVIAVSLFAVAGVWLAVLWRRIAFPHWADMCFGMLTLGNAGMLFGWWADNGFSALHDGRCCACVEAMRRGSLQPWMWVGMLVCANIAMRWFSNCVVPNTRHAFAMYTGGNAGMVAGMLAGAWCAGQVVTSNLTLAVLCNFGGMTIGMLAGMLAGAWLTERLLDSYATLRRVPQL